MPDFPFVSVVIPALNCAGEVAACVSALRRQDYPAGRFEIIIVDNGSTDHTLQAIRNCGATALQQPERGRARALNSGVEQARGELICTTDISCIAEPDWIRRVVDDFRDPRVAVVAGDIELLRPVENRVVAFQERHRYMSPMLALERRQLPFMPFADGANASFRRSLFDRIGLFEASFIKAADVEICYRMLVLTDYIMLFDAGARVAEPCEPDLYHLLRQRFRIGIGWNLMKMKYPQLFQEPHRETGTHRLYWRLREQLFNSMSLIADNLKVLGGGPVDRAADRNIRLLMGMAQAWGRMHGRRLLAREGIRPEPVDAARLAAFIADPERLKGRVLMTATAGSEAIHHGE